MTSILVTGANRGIGLEFARQYAAEGYRVHACCRQLTEAQDLRALQGDIAVHELDMSDYAGIKLLADALDGEAIDILINNAGVWGGKAQTLGDIDFDAWSRVLAVNTIAPIATAWAFLDHVARSAEGKLVFLTSQMGSIADNTSGGHYAYRSSKAALNAAVRSLAIDVAPRGVTALLLHPGWVKTRMGGPGATLDLAISIRRMRDIIAGAGPDQSGRFLAHDGREVPF
jgi:NAD(P)-dependent dehydrogenase (short-subunit alcohol dehydrogenase family)